MPFLEPLNPGQLPEFEPVFHKMAETLGYIPNSFLTMARDPKIVEAVGALSDASWYPATVSEPIRRLTAFAVSRFAGVPYSAAHCACGAPELGLPVEKMLAVEDYAHSPLFDDRERAVLRLCRHAARIPTEVTDGDVDHVKRHFGEDGALFLVGLICYMTFLNKWNEMLGTRLEDLPRDWVASAMPQLVPAAGV